jgi:hypothetical protein
LAQWVLFVELFVGLLTRVREDEAAAGATDGGSLNSQALAYLVVALVWLVPAMALLVGVGTQCLRSWALFLEAHPHHVRASLEDGPIPVLKRPLVLLCGSWCPKPWIPPFGLLPNCWCSCCKDVRDGWWGVWR